MTFCNYVLNNHVFLICFILSVNIYSISLLHLSEAQIKKHMASLRTQYSRATRQAPSGSAGKRATKRQDWIRSNLDFLAPFVKKRPSSSNLEVRPYIHISGRN